MVTVLTTDGLESFRQRFDATEAILIPIFADATSHPCDNVLSLLYVLFRDNGDEFIVPYNHSEVICRPWSFDSSVPKFVPNRKEFRHVLPLSKLIDVNLLQYVESGVPIPLKLEDTKAHTLIKRNYPSNLVNVNRIIPLSKHVEACRVLSSKMDDIIEYKGFNVDEPSFQFLNGVATDVFQQIESVGIYKDSKIVYSEYNLFTATGRPSNRFGGVNFAALNKKDGTRKSFTSRFGKDGMLVLVDYDAYHHRLIAELMGFKFPPGNVHEYLGRMYFGVDALTEELYDESKKISFRLLYGGIAEEYRDVPYFVEVQKFINYLWDSFQEKGYITSPIGQRKLFGCNMKNMHPQTLFNYFIQLHETEQNIMTLESVLPMFESMRSKLFMYTYDSVLIDFHESDGIDFLRKVKTMLECSNTYPVKVYVGASYHELVNVTDRFQ